ncbi:MAG: hypothetical protein CK604_09605 [Curvibacter sp. PD_MW3]|nr:MAG: hypothetical protein CK604_09605 [Curvibacter sp. PD_MW3]
MAWLARLKRRAKALKGETYVLYLAARHPATPWYAKLLVAVIVAYAFSPIDLIPDFVPVLGYLDDLVLIPLGIALAIKLVPQAVLDECHAKVQAARQAGKPTSRVAAVVIVLIWLGIAALGVAWGWRVFAG